MEKVVQTLCEGERARGVDSQVLYIWFYTSPIPKLYSKWAEDLGGYA